MSLVDTLPRTLAYGGLSRFERAHLRLEHAEGAGDFDLIGHLRVTPECPDCRQYLAEFHSKRRFPWAPIEELLIRRLGPPPKKRGKKKGDDEEDEDDGAPGFGATAENMALQLGVKRFSVFQYRKKGDIPDVIAERLAIELGVEPVCLWPDWYDRVEVDAW